MGKKTKRNRWEVITHSSVEYFSTRRACRAYISTFLPDERFSIKDLFYNRTGFFRPPSHFHSMAPEDRATKSRRVSKKTALNILERHDDGKITLTKREREVFEKIAGKTYKKLNPWDKRKDESDERYIQRINKLAKSA